MKLLIKDSLLREVAFISNIVKVQGNSIKPIQDWKNKLVLDQKDRNSEN